MHRVHLTALESHEANVISRFPCKFTRGGTYSRYLTPINPGKCWEGRKEINLGIPPGPSGNIWRAYSASYFSHPRK